MKLLEGKKVLIFGIANNNSIAWGIAQEMKEHGAQIALSYVNDSIQRRVEPLAEELGADFIFEMDVLNDDHYASLRERIKKHWDSVDVIVHSLAFADRKDLKDSFLKTSREGFKLACDVSAFSLVGLTQEIEPIMNDGGSVMALSYYGSTKVIQNYNVMGVAKAALESSSRYLANDLGPRGIRVNCISAGPVRTLASSGITGFKKLFSQVDEVAPMRRPVTQREVGGTAVYLASNLSTSVTGEVIYVDGGLSVLGGF